MCSINPPCVPVRLFPTNSGRRLCGWWPGWNGVCCNNDDDDDLQQQRQWPTAMMMTMAMATTLLELAGNGTNAVCFSRGKQLGFLIGVTVVMNLITIMTAIYWVRNQVVRGGRPSATHSPTFVVSIVYITYAFTSYKRTRKPTVVSKMSLCIYIYVFSVCVWCFLLRTGPSMPK